MAPGGKSHEEAGRGPAGGRGRCTSLPVTHAPVAVSPPAAGLRMWSFPRFGSPWPPTSWGRGDAVSPGVEQMGYPCTPGASPLLAGCAAVPLSFTSGHTIQGQSEDGKVACEARPALLPLETVGSTTVSKGGFADGAPGLDLDLGARL